MYKNKTKYHSIELLPRPLNLFKMKRKINCIDYTVVLAITLYFIVEVRCTQWYLTVNIPITEQSVLNQVESIVLNHPGVLSRSDKSSFTIAARDYDWESISSTLKSLDIKYSVVSETKQCFNCEDKPSISAKDDQPDDASVFKWIPPRTQNLKLIYENVLYTLTGTKNCSVTVQTPPSLAKRSSEDLQIDCEVNAGSNDDAWYFKSVIKSSVTCDDAETEGGGCFEYTATIHHIKFPGYGLSTDKNSLILSKTPQEFLISHVNGKNFREIILQKDGSPAKTAQIKSNVYIGSFYNGSFDLRVNKVHSKYDGADLLSSFPRVKIFNLASTTSKIPLGLHDTSQINGKRLLKELLVSNYVKAMFINKDQIIVELEDDGFLYKVNKTFFCSLGYSPYPHTAPFVDITFKSTILVDGVADDGTTVISKSLEDLHSAQYDVDTEGGLMSFVYPYTVDLLQTREAFYKLNFQPNKIMHLWKTAGDCTNYDIEDMPTCVNEVDLIHHDRADLNSYSRKLNTREKSFRNIIRSEERKSEEVENESYSYELPVTS